MAGAVALGGGKRYQKKSIRKIPKIINKWLITCDNKLGICAER